MQDPIYAAEDTRSFLKLYFESRRARANGLSLRQFAKKLGVSVAALSAFLSGRRAVSSEFILNFCDRAHLGSRDTERLLALHLISSEGSKASPRLRNEMRARTTAARKSYLSDQTADSLYHWRTGALLEATRVPALLEDRPALAEALGMTPRDLERLLDRLVEGGLLRVEEGKYRKTSANIQLAGDTAKKTLKRYHLDWLAVADRAIRIGVPEERHLGGETIAISEAELPEARRIVNRCLDELAALAAQSASPTAVYHCNVQLIPALATKTAPHLSERKKNAC